MMFVRSARMLLMADDFLRRYQAIAKKASTPSNNEALKIPPIVGCSFESLVAYCDGPSFLPFAIRGYEFGLLRFVSFMQTGILRRPPAWTLTIDLCSR